MPRFITGFVFGAGCVVGLARWTVKRWLDDAGRADPPQTMPGPIGWDNTDRGGRS
jgi:hypothetical protein